MRKKSHISLAQYLIKNIDVKDLKDHRKSFYMGSILPDIQLSFLTKRHTIEETFQDLVDEIKKITVDYDVDQGIDSYFARHLGVITHYLADYCTFPHNKIFKGSMKEHIHYENDQKLYIREYLKKEEVQRNREEIRSLNCLDDIVIFIKQTHHEYLKAQKVVKKDVEYIIALCYKVVDAILYLFECAMETLLTGSRTKMVTIEYSNA